MRLRMCSFALASAFVVTSGAERRPGVQMLSAQSRAQTLMTREFARDKRAGAESPLSANRTSMFAVAPDGVTLIRQSLVEESPWRAMPLLSGTKRITGIAATDDALYLADGPQQLIFRVNLSSGEPSVLAKLPAPFDAGDLAFADGLFVVDRASGGIFRVTPGGAVARVSPDEPRRPRSAPFLASNGSVLVASSPDDGTIWQATVHGDAAPEWIAVQRPSDDVLGPAFPRTTDIRTAQQVSYPLRPTGLAVQGGIVYVIDANTDGVFAYSRAWPRPVRLTFGPRPLGRPTRLVATPDQLIVLDGEDGTTVRWPRFVPTRISCALGAAPANSTETPCAATQYAALASVFSFLNDQQFLPVKPLPPAADLAAALRQAGYGTVTMVRAVAQIACRLNHGLCGPDGTQPPGATGRVIVPDVYGESFIDVTQVELSGGSFGEKVDAAVPSPDFERFRTNARLEDLNGTAKKAQTVAGIRQMSHGVVSTPVELVRFVVGIPSEQIRMMSARFKDVAFISLAEAGASRAGAPRGADAAQIEQVREANLIMRQKIGGTFNLAPQVLPPIGIAEHDIDVTQPDLAEAMGGEMLMIPVRSGANPAPAETVFTVRDTIKDDDHGTAVASIIAARPTQFDGPALAAGALLLPVVDSEPLIGESIRQAYINRVRIFNLSFHFGKNSKKPVTLEEAIKQYSEALFVVAAGNDAVTGADGNVCVSFEAYPVCWGNYPNVLVVTGTTLDGTALMPPDTTATPVTPGANWNDTLVHIAAPAEGFYASGRGRSYVKVRGTSFATPLVTATAALLYAQGVRLPWEIKQRIITTADAVSGLDGRVVAGRLNAKRAATNLPLALVVNELGKESAISLADAGAVIAFKTATEDLNVHLSNVRRLTRLSTGRYSLVFLDGDRLRRAEVIAGPWPFRYFEVDSQMRHQSGRKTSDLSSYKDYVGPIIF